MAKFVKTPKLEIVLQLTETGAGGPDGRAWEAHDVERNRGFRVTLTGRSLRDTPPGKKPLDRAFREDEIEGALGLAIERELVTPPEKVAGTLYNVALTSHDLYEFLALRG
jgi:hypothetical protein